MELTLSEYRKPSEATLMCYLGVCENNLILFKKGLKQGADVNYIDQRGKSLLYIACAFECKKIIKKLLKHKDIDVTLGSQQDKTSPFLKACRNNLLDLDIIKLIIKKNPQAAYTYSNGCTLLHYAAAQGDVDCIKYLLAHDKSVINKQDLNEETPFHLVFPHAGPLSKKHFKIIKLFIKSNANATITNKFHTTSLVYIFDLDHDNKLPKFIKKNPQIAQKLIRVTDAHHNSQLHLCTILPYFNQKEFQKKFQQYISFLIAHGVDPHHCNNDHKTAADLACEAYESLLKECTMEKDLDITEMVEFQNRFIHQEQIMHCLLRITSPFTKCALLKEILQQNDLYTFALPNDIKRYIAYFYYYAFNIETVVAQKVKNDITYYQQDLEKKNQLKQELLLKPEPHLLWSKHR